jgi:uncharacterized MAPEG superfamily protein
MLRRFFLPVFVAIKMVVWMFPALLRWVAALRRCTGRDVILAFSVCFRSNNDLENIPHTLILMWAALFCIARASTSSMEGLALAHIILATGFVLGRVLHTITYEAKRTYLRTLVFSLAMFAQFGLIVNGVVAAFSVPDRG